MIADDLKDLATPIDQLIPLPDNPRKGHVEAIAKSYEVFGQRKPIVAKRDGTVTDGNHQLLAAIQLGWSEIAVVFTDDDDLTAKAYALAANRTSDLGTYDDDLLAEMLISVGEDLELLAASAYTEEDIARLLEASSTLSGDVLGIGNTKKQAPTEFGEIDPYNLETQYRCPSCHYEWSGMPKPGA